VFRPVALRSFPLCCLLRCVPVAYTLRTSLLHEFARRSPQGTDSSRILVSTIKGPCSPLLHTIRIRMRLHTMGDRDRNRRSVRSMVPGHDWISSRTATIAVAHNIKCTLVRVDVLFQSDATDCTENRGFSQRDAAHSHQPPSTALGPPSRARRRHPSHRQHLHCRLLHFSCLPPQRPSTAHGVLWLEPAFPCAVPRGYVR
jgi:hypothetical protein